MSDKKTRFERSGVCITHLTLFSVGIDGLAYLIYARLPASASVFIPILLAWQGVDIIYFFRVFLPAYRRLDQAHSENRAAFMQVFQIAQILPAVIAIVIWTTLSTVSPVPH